MSWSTVRLGEVCDLLSGYAWRSESFNQDCRGIPIIRIQNVGHAEQDFVYWNEAFDTRFLIRAGDLLLTMSGSFRAAKWAGPDALLNQRIVKLTPSTALESHWLLRVLSQMLGKIEGMGRHALVNNVSIADLRELVIPLPPLAEQRRIAAILDAADALRQKRRQALHLLDQLSQSMFIETFGDLTLNDRGWRRAEVQDFVAGFESGKSLVAEDEDDDSSRYRVLKVSAVTSLFYRPTESKPLPPDYDPPEHHIVRAGDLLFSRANTSQLIGATALVDQTPANHVLPDKIWRFVWHDTPRADPYFVWYLFRQRRFRDAISRRATGTSGSMKNISQDKVLSIPVALPPLDLQREFGRQLKSILNNRALSESALYKQDVLFSSLQYRAFREEL